MADLGVSNSQRTAATNATRESGGADGIRGQLASPEISFEDIKKALSMAEASINRQLDLLQAQANLPPSKILPMKER